ncbi:ATP-binding protein [Mucilaginibacter paludis]|uniref:histidine kinase n=1 Tax=Mucilaginibacter paludis DSM 18603 TaxID=714943 RepID=H1YAT8_9SPHI|nr:ATP-binding protein [Mucilaginibacter paludis]EHQ29547.1 integral membrane sensor hybrid histidine kinase [Mucilaginibacter paludis DSM 18603]
MKIGKSLYAFLLLFCCLTAVGFANTQPLAKKGVVDLRRQSFFEKIPLDGQWCFYWHQLINPNDTTKHNACIVDFPFKWNGFSLRGETLPSFGYATYQLTVLLPSKTPPLSLSVPDAYCAYRLYLNGKMVAEDGRVSNTPEGFEAHWQNNIVDVPTGVDTLKVVLQIANFVHSKGGISKSIVIGERRMIDLSRRRSEAIDLLLTGCLFMGGLFFLGLYIFGNRDKAILLFSLYSIVYSYRIIGVNNYELHTILPDISWYVTIRLEYISLFAGIGLFGLYTLYLYPRDIYKPIVYVIGSICFLFSAASAVLPPLYFTQLINPFLIVTVFCLVFIPYVYIKAYRNKRPGSGYALASSFSLMVVFSISLFHYWAIIGPLQLLNFAGYVSFFFLQSLILSHRVSFALKRARAQAEQGLKAKSEFLSTMSHEIRTPLNSVIGMSHLLLKTNPRPDQVEHLDVMLFSANNLLAIVNDILDYNKIEAGKIVFEHTEMDIASIAGNIVAGLQNSANDKGIGLKLQVDSALNNKVIGDPTRLFQVISNLVHNAIKFTQAGGVEVGITVKGQTEHDVTLSIWVKDTGIGISKDKQKLIFERFTQADSSTSRGFGGTGLGLAISKRILELQNSTLQLESEEGKGSTFYFIQTFLKSIKTVEQLKKEDNLPKEDNKPFTGIHILLVEDNPMNVLVAQKFLQRWGADIDVAANGLEALNKLDISKHQLVLMDLHMPVMDGYESARNIRAQGISIPIIALTANLPGEIQLKVKEAGIDDIMVKPFLPDELYRKVLHYI